jgi:hypothetical protein
MIGTRHENAGAFARRANASALGAADWLSLAAAPTLAVMALLTGMLGGGAQDMLCVTARGASPLNGMVPMYVLMSAFHVAPWLKLVSSRCARCVGLGDPRPRVNADARGMAGTTSTTCA